MGTVPKDGSEQHEEVDPVTDERAERRAADRGRTAPAGEGVDDMEIAEQVHEQTSKDLRAEEVFERESDGAASDTAIDKAGPDETPD